MGKFKTDITDEELWRLWDDVRSTFKLSQLTGLSTSQINRRLAKIRADKGLVVEKVAVKSDQLVNSLPREVEGGGYLTKADYSGWKQGAKDGFTQQMIENPLDAVRGQWKFDRPAVVVPARKSKVVAYRAKGVKESDTERIFILGDVQLGFWAVLDPNDPQKIHFEPFHDEAALDVTMQALAVYRPHRVVIVGDFLDFPQLSKFQQEPQWAQTMQASIQEAYDLLAKIRKTVGSDCKIDFCPGNHETRLQRAICNGNPALYNLRRPGDKYAIYSIPSLLRFEDLKIECAAEYPSGEVWLAKKRGAIPGLVVTHADPKKRELRADAIHGHLVLPALETRQVFYEDGPVTYTRLCVSGCGNYSDTSDRVRLTRTNTPSGRSRMAAVPSFGTVDIDKKTGLRAYGLHLINAGGVRFNGKVITSQVKAGRHAA